MANRWGNNGNSDRLSFGAPNSLQASLDSGTLSSTVSVIRCQGQLTFTGDRDKDNIPVNDGMVMPHYKGIYDH